jgi:hypothetical protein
MSPDYVIPSEVRICFLFVFNERQQMLRCVYPRAQRTAQHDRYVSHQPARFARFTLEGAAKSPKQLDYLHYGVGFPTFNLSSGQPIPIFRLGSTLSFGHWMRRAVPLGRPAVA